MASIQEFIQEYVCAVSEEYADVFASAGLFMCYKDVIIG